MTQDSYDITGQKTVSGTDSGLGPQPSHVATMQDREAGNKIPSMYGEMYKLYSPLRKAQKMKLMLARKNWAERHWEYSRHYSRIFVTPKNAQNAETKRLLGAVLVLLLVILGLMTGAYSSLDVSQGLNPQPWLLKASVYHSATSAVSQAMYGIHFKIIGNCIKRNIMPEMIIKLRS